MIRVFGTVEEAIASKDRRAYLLGDEGPLKIMKYGGEQYPVEFSTITATEKVSAAPTINKGIKVTRIAYPSKELVEKAMAIFRAAYERFGTEMCVVLKWMKDEKGKPARYAIDRPEYALVSGAHVRHVYRSARMGIMHSHPTFSGVPSGIDDSNEECVPGVYMVIGDIKSSKPSITFSVCGDGFRQKEDYPYKEFDPPVLTKEESDWWLENVMTQSEADGKKDGWYIKDQQSRVVFWFATEEEAKAVAGEEYEVVKVPSYTVYTPYTPGKYSGYGDSGWEGEYEAAYRAYNAEWQRLVPASSDSLAVSAPESENSHAHLLNYSRNGKRRNKRNRGPTISFSIQKDKPGEWVELALRMRNLLGSEDRETRQDFLGALLNGIRPKPVVVTSGNNKFKVPSYGPGFVQPQKPRLILLPSGMPPREIQGDGVVYYPEVPAQEEAKKPERKEVVLPGDEPAVSNDDTAVMNATDIAEAVEAADELIQTGEVKEDPVEEATETLHQVQATWNDLLRLRGLPENSNGGNVIEYFEMGRLTEKETNDLLEAEGDVFLAQNFLAKAEEEARQMALAEEAEETATAGLTEAEKTEECQIMSDLLRQRGVIYSGDGPTLRMERLDEDRRRYNALGPGQGDFVGE